MNNNYTTYKLQNEDTFNDVTYDQYIDALDEVLILSEKGMLNEGIISSLSGITGKVGELVSNAKKTMGEILDTTKLKTTDLIKAFKNKDIFDVLKKFGFSIGKMLKAIKNAQKHINSGLGKVFKELHKTKVIQKLHSGAVTIDEVINKYPILNKIGGVVVAGLLLWIWLNMSFTGASLDFDIDQSALLDALAGNYSLAELFTSPSGLKTVAFLSLGLSGISVTGYLGSTAYNLTMSIIYTALRKSNFKDNSIMAKIKQKAFAIAEDYNNTTLSFKQFIQTQSFTHKGNL